MSKDMAQKKKCQRCKGSGMLEADLLNRGTLEYDTHIFGCDDCFGKGARGDETGRVYAGTSYRNERPYGPDLWPEDEDKDEKPGGSAEYIRLDDPLGHDHSMDG